MSDHTLPVPDLRARVAGHQFGGQYTHDADLQLLAQATEHGVRLTLLDTLDVVRYTLELNPQQADQVFTALGTSATAPVPDVPGLYSQVTWNLGDEQTWVDLLPYQDELHQWLSYATWHQVWPWDESTTWEY